MENQAEKTPNTKVLVVGGKRSTIKVDITHEDMMKARALSMDKPMLGYPLCLYHVLYKEGEYLITDGHNTPAKITLAVEIQMKELIEIEESFFEN